MKTTILTIAMLLAAISFASAQDAKQPAPKPTYQIDVNKLVTVSFTFSAGQINDYLTLMTEGGTLDERKDLSGYQITQVKNNAAAVIKSIANQFQKWIIADKEKFTADTTKKLSTPLKKP